MHASLAYATHWDEFINIHMDLTSNYLPSTEHTGTARFESAKRYGCPPFQDTGIKSCRGLMRAKVPDAAEDPDRFHRTLGKHVS